MKNRDYWLICFRNFRALAVLSAIATLLFVFGGVSILVVTLVISTICWILLARMFNKHSSKAISAAYTLIIILLAINLLGNVLVPSSFGVSSILFYLIYAYLLQCVHKAQKQSVMPV